MLLIPAIDLKDGHCVRLKQGDMDQSTTFGEDPAAMARKWVDAGARRLHLVDLNGAFAGVPKNYGAIKSILKEVGDDIPVQLGGGIRDLDTIEKYIDGGLRYVIIGTAAVKNPGFLQDACTAFGGHIIVGLDAKDGKVATDGWSKLTGHEVVDLAKKFEDWGVESIIYTDIGRDGMLSGINIDATVKLAQALTIPVIASGGLSNIQNIVDLCAVEDEGLLSLVFGFERKVTNMLKLLHCDTAERLFGTKLAKSIDIHNNIREIMTLRKDEIFPKDWNATYCPSGVGFYSDEDEEDDEYYDVDEGDRELRDEGLYGELFAHGHGNTRDYEREMACDNFPPKISSYVKAITHNQLQIKFNGILYYRRFNSVHQYLVI